MFINQDVMEEIYKAGNEKTYNRALEYYKEGKVKLDKIMYQSPDEFELKGKVTGKKGTYFTDIQVQNGEIQKVECTCQDFLNSYGTCKHSLATLMEFASNPIYEEKQKRKKKTSSAPIKMGKDGYREFKQVIQLFYKEELQKEEKKTSHIIGKVELVPKLIYDKIYGKLKVEFLIGDKKFYRIKNLSDFYNRMMKQENYRYGSKLEFVHSRETFQEKCYPLLDFVMKQAEIIHYVNDTANSNYRYYGKTLTESEIILGDTGLDELFEILKGKKVAIQFDGEEKISLIPSEPNIQFYLTQVSEEEFALSSNVEDYDYQIFQGKQYAYLLLDHFLYRCRPEFNEHILKLVDVFKRNYTKEIKIPKESLPEVFSLVAPKLKGNLELKDIKEEEIKEYIPQRLIVKLYLDYDKNNYLIAGVKFCYGETEFNPLDSKENKKIARNILEETEAMNLFRKTGFMLDTANKRFILVSDEAIYRFLSEDIVEYMKRFNVLVTDQFKKKEIREPSVGSIGVRVENNLLTIDFSQLDFSKEELQEIIDKYRLKKKYHRLKDGSFLELQQNEDIDFLSQLEDGMDLEASDLQKGVLSVPIYRSMYLDRLLAGLKHTQIIKQDSYKKMIEDLDYEQNETEIVLPKGLNANLRYYQKVGYHWLQSLNEYGLGGILADDMGLGKTIQVLALIQAYQETAKDKKEPSIVISPSSLALNWEKEASRFTPSLKTIVISGNAEERERKMQAIPECDLVITSYDILKRDAEKYEKANYHFQYAIADEAQYIKNSNTQNAKVLKQIKAKTRFALTGTPIENSLAELWSIFDYIMPGYLFGYRKFKKLFEEPIIKEEDQEAFQKLKKMIEPFILRRVKKEVLKELPEKSISVLNSEMEEEQREVYLSYLARAKKEVTQEIDINGLEKSHIKILALLTRLRQICCHPSLFIENYEGGSGKLNQCMELVKDAVEAGHKILIFSGYTSMFSIIEEKLKEQDVSYYKLTGQTKVEERMQLVEDFNNNPEIKVFLISLKAGGTGLNLIGADMVIHYDPWWNISAENQATDRAYRIGQKNNVQVYKLITKNSIEEKIYELQERKAKLIDYMLSTETTFLNHLSKEDIMELFEE